MTPKNPISFLSFIRLPSLALVLTLGLLVGSGQTLTRPVFADHGAEESHSDVFSQHGDASHSDVFSEHGEASHDLKHSAEGQ